MWISRVSACHSGLRKARNPASEQERGKESDRERERDGERERESERDP